MMGTIVLSGETMPTYIATEAGHYFVIITEGDCFVQSSTIQVEAGGIFDYEAPAISATNEELCVGGNIMLWINNYNEYPPDATYQWYFGTEKLVGETLPNYIINEGGWYYVEVIVEDCSMITGYFVKESENSIDVEQPIIAATDDAVLCEKRTVELYILNEEEFAGATYQWYYGAQLLVGETQPTLTVDYPNAGNYYVEVIIDADCSIVSEAYYLRLGEDDECCQPMFPPVVNSQFKVCATGGLTLQDIYVQGLNIQWFADEELTTFLPLNTLLEDETTYWVIQIVDGCESLPSQVHVAFVDQIEPIYIISPQYFCESGTYSLEDINLPISVTVKWYDELGGELNATDPIAHGETYYAAHVQGTCESEVRTPVEVIFIDVVPAPAIPSPQYFCEGAVIFSINTGGYHPESIVWYADALGIELLPSDHKLETTTYYAKLIVATDCESELRPVVIEIEPEDPDYITEIQEFCEAATIADIVIPTYGWGIIKWFADAEMENEITDLTTPLVDGETYYLFNIFGDCGIINLKVTIRIYDDIQKPELIVDEPVAVCVGENIYESDILALLQPAGTDITFKVFTDPSCTVPFPAFVTATASYHTFYVRAFAGLIECEGNFVDILPVVFTVNPRPNAPILSGVVPQICAGHDIDETFLLSLVTFGSADGVVYEDAWGNTIILPIVAESNITIYVRALFEGTGCTSAERLPVNITVNICVELRGTVFPFVHWVDGGVPIDDFNALFPITVSLKHVPATSNSDLFYEELIYGPAVYDTVAFYYDGTIFAEGTPQKPGMIGMFDNFGLPINWSALQKPTQPSNSPILGPNESPEIVEGMTAGLFVIKEVTPGTYMLEIKRAGFMTRWAKINVVEQIDNLQYLGHRELIPGDVYEDFWINGFDRSVLSNAIGSAVYNPNVDLYGIGEINALLLGLVNENYSLNFQYYHYVETQEWLDELGIDY